jgi:hypothetical protein
VNDARKYFITLGGQVTEDEANAKGPLQLTLMRAEPDATVFAVRTDQSGLVGLMRHLHGMGFELLSIDRER